MVRGARSVMRWDRAGVVSVGITGALALLLTGCSDKDGSPKPSTTAGSSAAASSSAKPAKFDPCKDIPQNVLNAENLENHIPVTANSGDITWKGCAYGDRQGKGYEVRIMTTNLTLDKVKAKYPGTYRDQSVGSRRGAYFSVFPERGPASCAYAAELASGLLEFDLSNPASAPKTGNQNACDLLSKLVQQVVPTISSGA
ncbi:DUF3558 domain-containing protein [Nocardia sp. NPDC052566]|uniref:DUF3558 domain-containing protein n=1 Tax=Nocardia sp. NPDC052566 TaxID=3364330 RepID=UPI0037C60149